jgi:allantoinase
MLHIVHVSSGRGVAAAAAARNRGVDVSIETCPHYLWFTEDDVERLGASAKCAPPLRSRAVQESLWSEVLAGQIDLVGSDHSPTLPAKKAGAFASAWGGIAGVQATLGVMIEGGVHARGLPMARVAALMATTPARRFRLPAKGALAAGHDADIAIVDINATATMTAGTLQQRHKISPYMGVSLRGAVRRTLRRGETIYADGRIVAQTPGRFVRPAR